MSTDSIYDKTCVNIDLKKHMPRIKSDRRSYEGRETNSSSSSEDEGEEQIRYTCTLCGKNAELECENCGTKYCSDICQIKDWPHHIDVCSKKPSERSWKNGELPANTFSYDKLSREYQKHMNGQYDEVLDDDDDIIEWSYLKPLSPETKRQLDVGTDEQENKEVSEEDEADAEKEREKKEKIAARRLNRLKKRINSFKTGGKSLDISSGSSEDETSDNDKPMLSQAKLDNSGRTTTIQVATGKATAKSSPNATTKSTWSMSRSITVLGVKEDFSIFTEKGGRAHQFILWRSLHEYANMTWLTSTPYRGITNNYFSSFGFLYKNEPHLADFFREFVNLYRLDMGVTWIDITSGPVDNPAYDNKIYYHAAVTTFLPVTKHKAGYDSTNPRTGLTFDSFHGQYQYWHSMSPSYWQKLSNQDLRTVIVEQAKEWFMTALAPLWIDRQLDRDNKPGKWYIKKLEKILPKTLYEYIKPDTQIEAVSLETLKSVLADNFIPDIFCIGHIIHMIQDSYAKGHVDRVVTRDISGEAVAPILNFIDYRETSTNAHKIFDGLDTYRKDENGPLYEAMRVNIATILEMYRVCVGLVQNSYKKVAERIRNEMREDMIKQGKRPSYADVVLNGYHKRRQITVGAIDEISGEFFDKNVGPYLTNRVYYIKKNRLLELSGQLRNKDLTPLPAELSADEKLVESKKVPAKTDLKPASIEILLHKEAHYYCTKATSCGPTMEGYEDTIVYQSTLVGIPEIISKHFLIDWKQYELEDYKIDEVMKNYHQTNANTPTRIETLAHEMDIDVAKYEIETIKKDPRLEKPIKVEGKRKESESESSSSSGEESGEDITRPIRRKLKETNL